MAQRHHRALRGAGAAWIATILAATSHTLAGGGAPAMELVAALGILASPLAVAMVGRRLSIWRLTAAVLASQIMFHAAFAMTAGMTGSDHAPPGTGHVHHAALAVDPSSGVFALPDIAMMLAHAAATVVTIAALYGGERLVRGIARGIRSLLSRAADVAPPVGQAARAYSPRDAWAAIAAVVLSDVSRRGPPSFVIAAA
jgi:hypothetical protein